jgi:hypothetical protein
MIIMPSNNTAGLIHYLAGLYPGQVGLLISPDGYRVPPFYMPFALDNGCFKRFDEEKYFNMLDKIKTHKLQPIFVTIPDSFLDPQKTLELYRKFAPRIKKYNFPLAYVIQDGCTPEEVPNDIFCCFIGGSVNWKISCVKKFLGLRGWLHIGRVNTYRRLMWAKQYADSVDGTSLYRHNHKNWVLYLYFGLKELRYKQKSLLAEEPK